MCQKSFIEMYQATKNKPTPSEVFIDDVARHTNRAKSTVIKWVLGFSEPSDRIKNQLSEYFNSPVEVLFPKTKSDDGHEQQ